MDYPPPSGPPPGYDLRQNLVQPNFSEPGTSTTQLPELTDDDARTLFQTPPPPRGALQGLPVPVCVPQISGGIETPFARGWNPQLRESGIEEADWFRFIDGLVRHI